jgi:AmiR/NasT family two-component response regulator
MTFKILIADDEPLIRVDLRELLEELGYEVVAEAGDGHEALKLMDQLNPDLVILDIKMPKMDGISVAKRISGHFPVIILSAYTERHLIEKARDAGVMTYLSKPFREGDLSPAVELAVNHFLRTSELTYQVTRLKEQLEARKVIDKAKGILMDKEGLNEAQAYRHLQKISMDKNKPMKEVAEAIILMFA